MAVPNTATATKITTTSAAVNTQLLAAAAKESPLINANPAQNQGSAGNSSGKANPPPGFEGPSPNLTGVSKPSADSFAPKTAADKQASVDQALGLVSRADAMKQLAGIGTRSTAGSSAKDKLTDLGGSSTTNNPGFDQGFASQPSNLEANTAPGGNPMAAFQGASVGGPLAGSQAKAPEGFDKNGLIASDKGENTNWFLEWVKELTNPNGDGKTRNGADQVKPEPNPNPDPSPTPTPVPSSPEPAPDPDPAPDPATPAPENQGSRSYLTQTILANLQASKAGKPASQGGSSDVTPVPDGGIGGVGSDGSIAQNQTSLDGRNLFGRPPGPAGENISGGGKGLNGFGNSNGSGVVNPGPDGGTPQGDARFQQDPGAALGGPNPTLAPPTRTSGQNDQSEQTSSVSATLAAGARNLTLTGTAAINGNGNTLDNLINGNGAANELRGDAGNDTLDGKAGNDLLDGGAGRDLLTGGSGADRFHFATAGAFGTAQADRITDFSRSEGERIELSRSAFGLSAGAAVSFQSVNSEAELVRAMSSSTLLIQDLRDGSILFNQNGTAAGAGQGGVFAVVSQGLTLQAGDFTLGV